MSRKPTHISPEAAKLSQAPLASQVDLGEKAKLRHELHSLQPEIEKVAKESAERRKLAANPDQQKRLAKLRQQEEENRKAVLVAQISAALAKQTDKEKRKNAAPVDNRPTPERAAKLAGVKAITPPIDGHQAGITKAHEAQGVVDFYHARWTYEEMEGARYLVDTWHRAAAGQQKVTASYSGTPGGAFGPRDGGVKRSLTGPEKFVDAHHHVLQIEAILHQHFGANGLNLIRWFAWETVRVAQEGASMGDQMVEAGRRLAPFVSDKARLWGVTFGSLQRIFHFAHGKWVVPEAMDRDRQSKHGNYRERLNAKGMGAEQLGREVDKEIASTPKGLQVVKGGKP